MRFAVVILFNVFAYATIVLRPKLYDVDLFKPMIKNFKLSVLPIFILLGTFMSFIVLLFLSAKWNIKFLFYFGYILAIGGLGVWLLMLPNANYLITELNLTHRDMDRTEVPIWYDIVSVISFAMSGVFNAVMNILLVQYTVLILIDPDIITSTHRAMMFGSAVVLNILASIGVYLGRYIRFYSWDILKPRKFYNILKEHFTQEGKIKEAISFVVMHSVFFTMVYMIFYNTFNNEKTIYGGGSMLKEFKEFASRGNFIDMAIGVVIGGAVGEVVGSITSILLELVAVLTTGINLADLSWKIGDLNITYGLTINAIIKFLIITFTMFLIIKAINKANSMFAAEEVAAEPTTKVCPYCKTDIPIDATRCPNCTSQLD